MTATSTINRTPGSPRPGAPGMARPIAPASRSSGPATIDPVRVIRQHLWALILSLVAGVVLGTIGHFGWALTYPIHQANTYWKVNLPKDDTSSVTDTSSMSGDQIDRYMATAAAQLLAPINLRQAINSPQIRQTKWIGKFTDDSGNTQVDDALDDLSDRLRASPFGETLLIRLSATGPQKDDLVAILTAVNNEFQRSLNRRREESRVDVTEPLTTQRNKVQTSIKALQDEINLRIEQNAINLEVENSDQALELNLVRLAMAEQQAQYSLLRSAIIAMEQRLAEPSLIFNDAERALARQDPNAAQLEAEVVLLRTSLRDGRQQFGVNHPQIKKFESRLESSQAELADEMQRVLERNFQAQLEAYRLQALGIEKAMVDLETQRQAAAARLNDLIKEVEWVKNKQRDLEALQMQSEGLDAAITTAQAVSAMEQTLQATLDGAPEADPLPVMPKLIVMVPLGILVSVGLTIGVVFLRELTDQRIKGPGDVAMLPRGQVLGVVPHLEEDPSGAKEIERIEQVLPDSVIAESIRQVQIPLARRIAQEGAQSVLMVPGQPGAGSSAILSSLAIVFARSGRKVLLVDADLRRPRQATIFGLHDSPGLGDVLAGEATMESAVQATDQEGLSALSAGSDRSRQSSRLSTPQMAQALTDAKSRFDLVLIDCAAAVVASDWEALANIVDANVLVVRALQEERGLVSRLIGKLNDSGSAHFGVIINGMRCAAGGYLKRNLEHMGRYQKSA